MDTQQLAVGSRIDHAQHGSGTITFVGADYLGIAFDASGEALIRRDMLSRRSPTCGRSTGTAARKLALAGVTFNFEAEDARHFPGSHWDPFVEESRDILGRLPEIVPKALPQTGYGQDRKSSRAEPNDWPKGFQLVWPLREKGLALVLRVESEANMVVSIFPFFAGGSQHTLTLSEVTVWESGVEAQITAIWGDGEVSFFDSQYSINRAWYETGRDYEFIFSGMAYNAAPAETGNGRLTSIRPGGMDEPADQGRRGTGAGNPHPEPGWRGNVPARQRLGHRRLQFSCTGEIRAEIRGLARSGRLAGACNGDALWRRGLRPGHLHYPARVDGRSAAPRSRAGYRGAAMAAGLPLDAGQIAAPRWLHI